VHRQDGAYRHRVSKTAQTLGCGHTDALLTLSTVELAGLARGISQRGQYWASGRKQSIFSGGSCQLRQTWPEDESALKVAGYESMMFERGRESMGGGSCEAGGLD